MSILVTLGLSFWLGHSELWAQSGYPYPGADPGGAHLEFKNDRVLLHNQTLQASWGVTPSGITAGPVRDFERHASLILTGEVFQVILNHGQCLRASELVREAKPLVRRLKPDAKAARFASRTSGKEAVIPLRTPDGNLRLVWRVQLREDAGYFRQELDLFASNSPVVVREIRWLDQPIPGARRMGRVDGSPVVAGTFYFGYEDPMAQNTVGGVSRPVGGWAPADLQLGSSRRKTWPLRAEDLAAGTNEFVFRYERGPHRLDITRVILFEDGREISRDEHPGRTGVEHLANEYRLLLPQLKPGARYELAADLGTDPNLQLPPGQPVDSYGQVWLTDLAGPVVCRLPRDTPLRPGEPLTQSFVMGVVPYGQLRRGFLHYLERERAHPYRPFLHYNSWYDIAWHPFALNETNCLDAIRTLGEQFIQPHRIALDAVVFDDGWDDPQTLWQFHHGFPDGFAPLAKLCQQYRTHLGVWLSPFGGYGSPRDQRLKFGSAQGFETNATGFSLAGSKYYAAFKNACVTMIRTYGVNHFKFDGIASGMYANGSGPDYILDTEAMRRLMLELREEDPRVYINLTTGSWPSPFWLRYADSVWRQGGDMGQAGKGTKQQQWLTYRDQEVYRNIVQKGPLFPLSSLMTQGVAYSREGMAGDPSFTSAGFKDDVRAFFGAGTSLQELYIQPGKLTAEDWAVLAEAARWSRAYAPVLVDTHWVSGDPAKLEPYGYASWIPNQGIVMLRNPDDQPRVFRLDLASAFQLAPEAPRRYLLRRPWQDERTIPALTAEAGTPLPITLEPFQVLVLNATVLPSRR